MSDEGEIIYYSAESEPERLTATTVHDAVVDAVDQWAEPPGPDDEIEVTSYKRMELPPRETIAGWVIDHVTEQLDEEFGRPGWFFHPEPERCARRSARIRRCRSGEV